MFYGACRYENRSFHLSLRQNKNNIMDKAYKSEVGLLFEKNALGGVCLNEGCVPTKTLLIGAHLLGNMEGKILKEAFV